MWADNETTRDFVNFSAVAESVAELIARANGRPISIGISGEWGVGKSSMIKLVEQALRRRGNSGSGKDVVLVEFNAWLYQGYDDARAALLDVIASTLAEEAEKRQTGADKIREFAKRIRWVRVAKLTAGLGLAGAAFAMGLPPIGWMGGLWGAGTAAATGTAGKDTMEGAESDLKEGGEELAGLIGPRATTSPPREIQALRDSLEDSLDCLGITLVVLIDDLDRCLPVTTIATLEAIRLFLFLENTAFVIAADTTMIKHAVRKHFEGFEKEDEDRMVTNYFDKLVQVPIRVPPLGTQEVRAYLLMLFVDNSTLHDSQKDQIRETVARQLQQSWQGKRVDAAFVKTAAGCDLPPELIVQLESADRLAPLMVSSPSIAGNPRLIKRFLNAVSIRVAVAKAQGVNVDEAVLAKLLLFERLAPAAAYAALTKSVNEDANGHPTVLGALEEEVAAGGDDLATPWDGEFLRHWLTLAPPLANTDLRGALYVGREHAPLITPEDRLSSEAAEALEALLGTPEVAASLLSRLKTLPRADLSVMMAKLLGAASKESEWGVPPILDACLVMASLDSTLEVSLAAFLSERPVKQLKPNIVPKLKGLAWAEPVFGRWRELKAPNPVLKAMEV